MAWSTYQPLSRCGNRYDIIRDRLDYKYYVHCRGGIIYGCEWLHIWKVGQIWLLFGWVKGNNNLIAQYNQSNTFSMSSADQSNVAIKMHPCDQLQYVSDWLPDQNPQEIDIVHTPIITQNVPFTNPIKPVSPCYIFINIHFLCILVLMITLLQMPWLGELPKYLLISYTIISYILYLTVAYHFSHLIFFSDLRSLHQYEAVFSRLVTAECALKFSYLPARNHIDQGRKKYEEEYKQVRIVDRSGKLYHIQRHYSLALIQYRKRFYYSNSKVRERVANDFHNFTERCRREFQSNRKKLLNSKEKIELQIGDMANEVGYYIQEDNHYKAFFLGSLLLGFGAGFEFCMRGKVLRYEMDIVKEICLK